MHIHVSNKILTTDIPERMVREIAAGLTMRNPSFSDNEKRGRWNGATPEHLYFYEKGHDGGLVIPRGYCSQLMTIAKKHGVPVSWTDGTRCCEPVDFGFKGMLRPYQERAATAILKRRFGVLESPTGSGKTVTVLKVIAERKQPALVVVHTKELLNQWIDRIHSFLGIPKGEIGVIGGGKMQIGSRITVSMVQSLCKCREDAAPYIGHLIVDECFPCGTKVQTPKGAIRIEDIRVNDTVKGYDHKTARIVEATVHHVFQTKAPSVLCQVVLSDRQTILCTPNHPFFDGNDYTPAAKLVKGQFVWRHCNENLSGMWKGETINGAFLSRLQGKTNGKKAESCNRAVCFMRNASPMPGGYPMANIACTSQSGAGLLFTSMCGTNEARAMQERRSISGEIQSGPRPNEQNFEKSHERGLCGREDAYNETKERDIKKTSRQTGRQWAGAVKTPEGSCRCFGVGDGGASKDIFAHSERPKEDLAEKEKFADLLQAGCCKCKAQSRSGGGRCESQWKKDTAGPKEKGHLERVRVESIALIEQADRGRFSRVCQNGYVYNIETDTGNYFAENILVHNCHRCPSRTFTEAVTAFDSRFMLGLSATPFRRDRLTKLIYLYLGDRVHSISQAELTQTGAILPFRVKWVKTAFETYRNPSLEYSAVLSDLTRDRKRNALVSSEAAQYANSGGGIPLIISDRKEHCRALQESMMNNHGIDADVLVGELSGKDRSAVIEKIHAGGCQVLIATGALIGEGIDLPSLGAVLLSTPIRFEGRVIQAVGRALRPSPGQDYATVIDFVDVNVGVLEYAAKQRVKVYEGMGAVNP